MHDAGNLGPLELEIIEENLGEHNNVSIILEANLLMQKDNYGDIFNASFTVTVVPQNCDGGSHRVNVINGTHIELKVTYNIRYNVSAVGNICGRNTETFTIQLLYSEFNQFLIFKVLCVSTGGGARKAISSKGRSYSQYVQYPIASYWVRG